ATHTSAVRVLAVTLEAAGVDEEHGAIVEDGDGLVDVARHPRRRVDDGLLPTQEAIEERRLAGIRAAGEHDTRQRLRGGTAGTDVEYRSPGGAGGGALLATAI